MQTKTLKLYNLGFSDTKTYLLALCFIAGNIILPQLCHLVPQGGFIFLPIYFFTLVAAYKYGIKVGLMTAILSPVVNHLLFGMPPFGVLPAILLKSVFLAGSAAFAAHYFRKISIFVLLLVVMSYQIVGTAVEWLLIGDFTLAIQDFRLGIPGMLIQIVGGFFAIKYIGRLFNASHTK